MFEVNIIHQVENNAGVEGEKDENRPKAQRVRIIVEHLYCLEALALLF